MSGEKRLKDHDQSGERESGAVMTQAISVPSEQETSRGKPSLSAYAADIDEGGNEARAAGGDLGLAESSAGAAGRRKRKRNRSHRQVQDRAQGEATEVQAGSDQEARPQVMQAGANEEARPAAHVPGMVFLCNEETRIDCFRYKVFGLPEAKKAIVEKVKKGARLFLLNRHRKVMEGIFRATCDGGMNLVPAAFQGRFPAQIRFRVFKDCTPLRESQFVHAIRTIYNVHRHRLLKHELSYAQVRRLSQAFPPPPHSLEPADWEFEQAAAGAALALDQYVNNDQQLFRLPLQPPDPLHPQPQLWADSASSTTRHPARASRTPLPLLYGGGTSHDMPAAADFGQQQMWREDHRRQVQQEELELEAIRGLASLHPQISVPSDQQQPLRSFRDAQQIFPLPLQPPYPLYSSTSSSTARHPAGASRAHVLCAGGASTSDETVAAQALDELQLQAAADFGHRRQVPQDELELEAIRGLASLQVHGLGYAPDFGSQRY